MASGFADFAALGSFLNDENKRLTEQVEQYTNEVAELEEKIEEQNERYNIMTQHLSSVKAQLTQTTQLVRAKEKEAQDEEHQKDLNLRQMGKLQELLKNATKEALELEERNSELQNHLFRRKDEIDALKASFHLNQVEYDNWQVVLKQKEADITAIEKYSSADSSHIRDLQMNLERMQKELSRRKTELEQEVTNTQSLQIELDKTAEDFQKIQKRRHDLVKQFEDLINSMKERDEMIERNREVYNKQKQDMSKLTEAISDQRTILEQHQADNKRLETQINTIDAGLQRLLTEHQTWSATVQQATDEVSVQRGILTKAQVELNQTNVEVENLKKQIEQKRVAVDRQEKKLLAKKGELNDVMDETKSKEEQSEKVESMLAEEESRLNQANRELKELKEEIFKHGEILHRASLEKSTAIAELNGAETSIKNLNMKIKKLDSDSLRQNELIYHADFQIQLMERKIPRAQGVRSDEEKQVLNAKINELTEEVNGQTKQWNVLSQQVKRLEEELHEVTSSIEKKKEEKKHIESKIADLKLENDNTVRSLTQSKTQKEELAVRHDVLHLEMKRLTDTFHQRHAEVVSLKNRQAQLELTIRERNEQIKVHNDLLRAELRQVEEEKHKVALELNERTMKIERLKQKYESVIGLRGGTSEESAQSHGLAIVKARQRRQELEVKGDELFTEIKAKQKELQQMEKALEQLEGANKTYRESFKTVGASSQEVEEKQAAEEQHHTAQERLKAKRAELAETTQLAAFQERGLAESDMEVDVLTREVQEYTLRRQQLEKDVQAQVPKIERAQKQLQKLSRDHRSSYLAGPKEKGEADENGDTPIEKEFQLDELRETNNIILSSLLTIGQQNKEIGEMLSTLLAERHLSTKGIASASASSSSSSSSSSLSASTSSTSSRGVRASQPLSASRSRPSSRSAAPSNSSASSATPVAVARPKSSSRSSPSASSSSTSSRPSSSKLPPLTGTPKRATSSPRSLSASRNSSPRPTSSSSPKSVSSAVQKPATPRHTPPSTPPRASSRGRTPPSPSSGLAPIRRTPPSSPSTRSSFTK
ncbi:putative Flagella associated protein [Monocercomonoides exilis]|uniref:putative Flagella associated protein n=1 Tax=Monocercomonoides exilis TaxID=2049356 RepID=UPI003559B5A5|nr:putative Flagella associated protein [Monocercomonoides exilis]|eukprot:MONOS_329.1-p1 / transcript=MONOS_329.1 / gene=MONOS_329 / organism=Monocercomonoides_exilis_PA203 / gene_product=Flagella associated protein / transcript_product=Flagella associated protein / location=Mono_scaffold00005:173001-176584(-) / protein_length=1053 / sequence_SO=supercontig / SO=protein_coding / is_pseudo=false